MFGKKLNKDRTQVNPRVNEELNDALPFVTDALKLQKKAPIEYEQMKRQERAKTEEDKKVAAKELLLRVIDYNNKTGNKTVVKFEKDANLLELYNALSENELRDVYSLLKRAHDPLCLECNKSYEEGISLCPICGSTSLNRLIKTIPDHENMNLLLMFIKHRIVGFTEELEIETLKKQLNSNVLSLEEKMILSSRIQELQKHKERKLQEVKRTTEDTVKVPLSVLTCEGCGKEFKNAGGKGSHQRTCEPFKALNEV